MNIYQDILLFFGVLVLIVFIGACDDRTINPYEDEVGIFSVYGALDVNETRHVIRVRNLLEPFQTNSEFSINATITFSNLVTGTSTVLEDSIVQFPAGKVHNYILNGNLQLDTPYQLTVERSDGAIVQTSVTTPAQTDVFYEPEKIFYCEEPIYFYFDNVDPPEFITMDVGVLYQGEEHWAPIRIVGDFKFDSELEMMVLFMRPRNLLVEIFPPEIPLDVDYDRYLMIPKVSCDDLDKEFFMFRYIHFAPEWAKGQPVRYGPIDIESGDIENGLGFLGAYRRGSFSFEFEEDMDIPFPTP